MEIWLEDWLRDINDQFRKEELPYINRPFEALSRLSKDRGIRVSFPSPFADQIFKWFEQHSPAGAHAVGSLFTSSFYYDAFFWPVEVPIAYGIVNLNALDGLKKMPQSVKAQFQTERTTMWQYVSLWTDSVDYGFGIDDLGHGKRLPKEGNQVFAAKLTSSADRELRGCVRLLTEARTPNSKALESAKMAMEMFLKAFLAVHDSLTEEDAQKKYGHHLGKLTDARSAAKPHRDVVELKQFVNIFPAVGERYDGAAYPNQRLWSGFAAALRTAVTFTRSMTDRDNRDKITAKS